MAPMSKGKWRQEQSIPDVPFQQALYKEIFLKIETEQYFCFMRQAGEQRRLVVCWGIRHFPWESLQNAAVPKTAPGPSDVPAAQRNAFLAEGKRLLLHFCCCRGNTSPMSNTS